MHRSLLSTANSRSIRCALLTAVLAALFGVLAVGGTTALSAGRRCYPPGSRTLVRTRLVRIYTTRETHYRALVSCLIKADRPASLDYTSPGIGGWFAPPAIDVHGTLFGWANTTNGDASGRSLALFIQDLARLTANGSWSRTKPPIRSGVCA